MGGDPLIPSRAIASGHSNLPVSCMTGVGPDDTRLPQDGQEPQEQPGCELQWAGPEMHIAHHPCKINGRCLSHMATESLYAYVSAWVCWLN